MTRLDFVWAAASRVSGPTYEDQAGAGFSPLLRHVSPIDLFVHDSRHSEYNVLFELGRVWQSLREGGAIVVDDIDVNWGFHIFTQSTAQQHSFVVEVEPIRPDVLRFNHKGLLGIILKDG